MGGLDFVGFFPTEYHKTINIFLFFLSFLFFFFFNFYTATAQVPKWAYLVKSFQKFILKTALFDGHCHLVLRKYRTNMLYL